MITLVCFVVLCVLALRSILLMLIESKPFPLRLFDFYLVLMFGACAFAIWLFTGLQPFQDPLLTLLILIIVTIPIALSMILRLRKPYHRNFLLISTKTLLLFLILFASLVAIMTSGFLSFTQDRPVLKITMTGIQKQEQVEWKSPQGELRKETLISYEVLLETPEEKPINTFYVYGDQVAVKARVLRFRPILNVSGLSNLCRIEFIFNGYTTAERHNSQPHRAQELSMEPLLLKPFQKKFWNFWESIYYLRGESWWVKSATLESGFFPLVHPDGSPFQGSFYLTITPGGISSIPASD